MGEAMLVRRGGGGAGKLTMVAAPAQTQYYVGETFDKTGLIVGADFGTYTLPIDASAVTITPDRPLTASDTSVTASVRVGTRTLTLNVPVTVGNFDSTLNNCSWADIARAAALGAASSAWRVGDIKYDYFNGTRIGFRIIGFDHDDLDETDSRYGDSTYNGGTNKAAITFQFVSAAGEAPMNSANTNAGGWDASRMRKTTMPSDAGKLPGDARNVLRTVKKYACGGGYGQAAAKRILKSADALFLLNYYEITNTTSGTLAKPSLYEANYTSVYEWHESNRSQISAQWTRSCHSPEDCSEESHFCTINGTTSSIYEANEAKPYYPAFCI